MVTVPGVTGVTHVVTVPAVAGVAGVTLVRMAALVHRAISATSVICVTCAVVTLIRPFGSSGHSVTPSVILWHNHNTPLGYSVLAAVRRGCLRRSGLDVIGGLRSRLAAVVRVASRGCR